MNYNTVRENCLLNCDDNCYRLQKTLPILCGQNATAFNNNNQSLWEYRF